MVFKASLESVSAARLVLLDLRVVQVRLALLANQDATV